MRVFMRGGSGRFEVLSNDRRTHTMHCRWPHNGAEFDWTYRPEWLKQYFKIETEEDDDA